MIFSDNGRSSNELPFGRSPFEIWWPDQEELDLRTNMIARPSDIPMARTTSVALGGPAVHIAGVEMTSLSTDNTDDTDKAPGDGGAYDAEEGSTSNPLRATLAERTPRSKSANANGAGEPTNIANDGNETSRHTSAW